VMRLISRDSQRILPLLTERFVEGAFSALAPWSIHSKQGLHIPDGQLVRSCRKLSVSGHLSSFKIQAPTNSDNIPVGLVEFAKFVNIFDVPGHPQPISLRELRSKWARKVTQTMKGQSVSDDTEEKCSEIAQIDGRIKRQIFFRDPKVSD